MSVAETILVFVGIPLAIVVVIALLVFLPGGRRKRPRYRPGQPWEHAPIWYEPHPDSTGHGGHAALESGAHVVHTPTGAPLGGARGTW